MIFPLLFVAVGEVKSVKVVGSSMAVVRQEILPGFDVFTGDRKIYIFQYGDSPRTSQSRRRLPSAICRSNSWKNFKRSRTPGTNTNVPHQDITHSFVPLADLIIFVFLDG